MVLLRRRRSAKCSFGGPPADSSRQSESECPKGAKSVEMANSLDATALVNIAKNRSRLLKLADGIRTRKKPGGSKKCMRLDPGYTNIEHLVFGTYRARPTSPDVSPHPENKGFVRRVQSRNSDGSDSSRTSSEPTAGSNRCRGDRTEPTGHRCECSRHSPHLRLPPPGSAVVGGDASESGGVHVESEERRQCDVEDMNELQRGRPPQRKVEDPSTPRRISWRDVAASRAADAAASRKDDQCLPRASSVRVYSSHGDRATFERQNTFPSGIPKPVERQQRTRTQCPKSASVSEQSPNHRKSSSQGGRSSGLLQRNSAASRNTEEELSDGKASAVTCKIRITPPNGPAKGSKVQGKCSPKNSPVKNGLTGSKSNLWNGEEKPKISRTEEPRARSRSRGHQHGMQSAVQKGERQRSGIPGPEHHSKERKKAAPKRPGPDPKVFVGKKDEDVSSDKPPLEETKKTTWAQLRSRSMEAPEPVVSKRRDQFASRQYHSLDQSEQDTSPNLHFDCSPLARMSSGSTIRLDVAPVEPASLPAKLPESIEPVFQYQDSPRPRAPQLPPLDGPMSLPLSCDDEESTIMCESSISQDEVQLRPRANRALGSPSRHFDLRLLAAYQRFGEEAAKEVLEAEGWMSDIEERDENSSSGASRAASEEPPDLERKSPRRVRAKASLGLERLLETPKNVSVIAIETQQDSPAKQLSSPRIKSIKETFSECPPDVSSVVVSGGGPRPDSVAQTSGSCRPGMSDTASPPCSGPPLWSEKSVTIQTGALTNCHLLVNQDPTGGSPARPPSEKPCKPLLVSGGTPVPASCRLLRNRPISRSERHLKTTSTPEIRASEAGSVKDVRRPWSEVYCEVEARNLLAQSSSPNCHSVPNFPRFEAVGSTSSSATTESGLSFFHRLSSTRATDSMLQKFRKTFSLRFQRSAKGKTDVSWTPSLPGFVAATPTSDFSVSPGDVSQTSIITTSDGNTVNVVQGSVGTVSNGNIDATSVFNEDSTRCDIEVPVTSSRDTTDCAAPPQQLSREETAAGMFRLHGLSALRSSRERKKGKSKQQKKEARGSKCNSADSGIQVETTCPSSDGTNEANSAGESPAMVRRRATSQSQQDGIGNNHLPISDYLADETLASIHDHPLPIILQQEPDPERERSMGEVFQELDTFNTEDKFFSPVRRSTSVERQLSTPPPIKVRSERIRPKIRRQRARARLRRSISQPLDLEKLGLNNHKPIEHGLSDQEVSREPSTASSEEDFSSDNEGGGGGGFQISTLPKQTPYREMYEDTVTFAEALWDHVTIDPEELPFKAGEVIEVTDSSDKDWWWGAIGNRSGWFPAAFVRLRVSQEATVEDCILRMSEGSLRVGRCQHQSRKMSVSLLSNEQVRANIVREIVTTERDFVRHLKDVVEGYLSQVRRRPDMFTEEHISTIFGNVEDIYQFQSIFLKHLESSINWQLPHSSEIGHCFLLHKDHFRIYSEYCNNHPLAVSQLQELYADPKYIHFFEACRLLQEMIDISLDGFLLTPVQKICKYPLQLAELLKYTRPDHADYQLVRDALGAMRGVAQLVNERKRRMECLERLIEWQKTIEGWEDGDLLESSSMLIHSGEVTRVTSSWSRDLSLFLFDHTIIYCKKDLLKRNVHVYRGRINLDHCCVFDVEDGKDAQFGITVRNAWKIHCNSRDKWFLFYAKSPLEKSRWLQAFREERQQVTEDRDQGFQITDQAKKAAKLAVLNKSKVKRPRAKIPKGPRPHPDTAVVEILLEASGPKTRSGSLPSNLNPAVVVNGNARNAPAKKKGSGWFHFGSGKKSKK